MPYCHDDGTRWCNDLETVYTDAEGKKYCVFHAPQGNKGVSLEEFNALVFARIREAQKKKESCDLWGTIFEGDINFMVEFFKDDVLPSLNFSGAEFKGDVDFSFLTFSEGVFFLHAVFGGRVDYTGATFDTMALFEKAVFRTTNFYRATCNGNVSFSEVTFSGDANFRELTISKKGEVNFIGDASNKNYLFKYKVNFNSLDLVGTLKFENVDLSKAYFANTQIHKIDFVNVKWHKSGWRGWRDTLYDEIALFERIKEGPGRDEDKAKTLDTYYQDFKRRLTGECHGDDIRKVGILYRRMKDKYRTLQNWPEVSNWHYGEKEMYRKETAFRRYFPFSFSFLYWLSSGYGERYVKAGIVLAVLLFMLSLGLAWTGLDAAPRYGSNPGDFHGITSITLETLDVKSIGALLINTMKYATFQKDVFFVPRNMWGEIIRCIVQILIPLQTALFILAVRNRFRK